MKKSGREKDGSLAKKWDENIFKPLKKIIKKAQSGFHGPFFFKGKKNACTNQVPIRLKMYFKYILTYIFFGKKS